MDSVTGMHVDRDMYDMYGCRDVGMYVCMYVWM